jgi:uncharacterized protein (UPF0332 family)
LLSVSGCATMVVDGAARREMAQADSPLYLERARQDLKAARSNLQQGFYAVTVTRAYYAMFYAASALLASKGIARSKHSAVLAAFGEHFARPGLIEADYAKALGHAFDARLDSDYDVTFATDRTLAEDVPDEAQRFVERAEQYLREVDSL